MSGGVERRISKRPLVQIPASGDYMVLGGNCGAEDWIENPISTTVLRVVYISAREAVQLRLLRVVILAGWVSRRFVLQRIFHL
jgi:hypothetical protein